MGSEMCIRDSAHRGRTATVAECPPWPHARHGTTRRVGEGTLLALVRRWGTEREREVSVGGQRVAEERENGGEENESIRG